MKFAGSAAIVGFVLAAAPAVPAVTGTIVVPDDQPTIQQAIDAAFDGDRVEVRAGVYAEAIDFKGKAIVVTSVDGALAALIDATGLGTAVTFQTGEGAGSVLEGFEITGGGAASSGDGGGVRCLGSAGPTIRGNQVHGNVSPSGAGGGVYVEAGDVQLEDNVIDHNVSGVAGGPAGFGGGVRIVGASSSGAPSKPLLRGNVIQHNECPLAGGTGGGVYVGGSQGEKADVAFESNVVRLNWSWIGFDGLYVHGGTHRVVGNRFEANGFLDLAVHEGSATIERNEIASSMEAILLTDTAVSSAGSIVADNRISGPGSTGSIGVYCNTGKYDVVLRRNTIVGFATGIRAPIVTTRALIDHTIVWDVTTAITNPSRAVVAWSDVEGGFTGTGNLAVDPAFVDPANGDFRLASGSPCVDTGDRAHALAGTDLDGNPRVLDGDLDRSLRIDLGAYERQNVRLSGPSSAAPGDTVTFQTRGLAGASALLFLASASGETPLRPFGIAFVDFASPWMLLPIGTVPVDLTATIPADAPVPLSVVLQALAVTPVGGKLAGNLSNAIVLAID